MEAERQENYEVKSNEGSKSVINENIRGGIIFPERFEIHLE